MASSTAKVCIDAERLLDDVESLGVAIDIVQLRDDYGMLGSEFEAEHSGVESDGEPDNQAAQMNYSAPRRRAATQYFPAFERTLSDGDNDPVWAAEPSPEWDVDWNAVGEKTQCAPRRRAATAQLLAFEWTLSDGADDTLRAADPSPEWDVDWNAVGKGKQRRTLRCCRQCQDPYMGFGDTCSSCRRLGRRGAFQKCAFCSQFFAGFGDACQDCQL